MQHMRKISYFNTLMFVTFTITFSAEEISESDGNDEDLPVSTFESVA